MEKQPRNIKFNWFSILNLSFGLNGLFILEKLGMVIFKSTYTLFLTAAVVFSIYAFHDLLWAFFRTRNPAKLLFKNTKYCGWCGGDVYIVWSTFFAIGIVCTVATTKLAWFSLPNTSYGSTGFVFMLCMMFGQYWYFYNDLLDTTNQE